LRSGDPAGLCPKCLMQGAFDSSVGASSAGADGSGTETVDTVTTTAGDDDFGRYHILRPLGEGGMGTVYLAEQHEPIRRRVALKVVKLGMDTGQVLARFANERQALAMMDHPNIARIFDAGATPKGRPYFVMEYIEGVPITQYCDGKRMTIGRRLELFLSVCRAVHHAHQKGVIHRDLKPSNVLAMEQEGAPVPKVIDFGIAKATDQWAVENTLLTQFGQMVGTPEYASPEQADVMTGDVDESSDVYSLGVLLYELLIGTVPFEAARLRQAGLVEMLRIIREEEAPPLARKPSAVGAAAADVAARRQTDPASLRRLVDGDLNSIAMKAVEKVRGRRYASVAELAADIQRYTDHRPVLAWPPSVLHRARKFVRRHRVAVPGAAAGLAFIVLSGLMVWSLVRRASPLRPRLTDKDTVVLAGFANTTGDPVFDGTLRQGLSVQLEQSPFLSIVSDDRMQQTLQMMGQKTDAKLTPEIARDLCQRVGSAALITGSIAQIGAPYLLTVKAVNCSSGDTLASTEAQAADKSRVLDALGKASSEIRARLGESLSTVQKFDTPLEEATTSSLEALKAYSEGMRAITTGNDTAAAIPFFKRAIEFDPHFALAYGVLSLQYADLGESSIAADYARKAYELRGHTSEPEKYFATARYNKEVTGNIEAAIQVCQLWIGAYPRSWMPRAFLGGSIYPVIGEYEKAVREGKEAVRLGPSAPFSYGLLMGDYIALNRVDEARAIYEQAHQRKLSFTGYGLSLYQIAFLQHDSAGMAQQAAASQGQPGTEDEVLASEAETAAYYGQLEKARDLSRQAMDSAERADEHEAAATYLAMSALQEALFGNANEARQRATLALERSRARDVQYGAALAFAFAGDNARAEMLARELAMRYPQDTLAQFNYLPALRGRIALNRRNVPEALAILRAATPYELGLTTFSVFGWTAMYPVYVRGEAYLAALQVSQAAAEFQKILDHPGIVLNYPIGSMARLQLARALSASGDRTQSAAAYKKLLALWKDADPDVPVIQQARAESAKQD
jgi:eukaryotic-like serine/threonine-protein kinase